MKFVCLDFSFYAKIYKSKANIFLARFLRYSTHHDQFFFFKLPDHFLKYLFFIEKKNCTSDL